MITGCGLKGVTREGKRGQNFERGIFTELWEEKREGARDIIVSDIRAHNSREKPA